MQGQLYSSQWMKKHNQNEGFLLEQRTLNKLQHRFFYFNHFLGCRSDFKCSWAIGYRNIFFLASVTLQTIYSSRQKFICNNAVETTNNYRNRKPLRRKMSFNNIHNKLNEIIKLLVNVGTTCYALYSPLFQEW